MRLLRSRLAWLALPGVIIYVRTWAWVGAWNAVPASPIPVHSSPLPPLPWLLREPHTAEARQASQFSFYCGYTRGLGMWNGFPLVRSALSRAGYVAVDGPTATVLIVPSYMKLSAPDWRKWRLSPLQRINRLWGMELLSRKNELHRTLKAAYRHRGGCPFVPRTLDWPEVRQLISRRDGQWERLVTSRRAWLLKTTAHRGNGLRLVRSEVLLALTAEGTPAAADGNRSADTADGRAHVSVESDAGSRMDVAKGSAHAAATLAAADALRTWVGGSADRPSAGLMLQEVCSYIWSMLPCTHAHSHTCACTHAALTHMHTCTSGQYARVHTSTGHRPSTPRRWPQGIPQAVRAHHQRTAAASVRSQGGPRP